MLQAAAVQPTVLLLLPERRSPSSGGEVLPQEEKSFLRRRSPSSGGEVLPQEEKSFLRRRSPSSGGEVLPQEEKSFLRRRSPSSGGEVLPQAAPPAAAKEDLRSVLCVLQTAVAWRDLRRILLVKAG